MPGFDEQRQKAFDFCADATKQLITISAGIIAFTVTFSKDFVSGVLNTTKILAFVSWGFHFLSILFGILVLYTLTAQLEPSMKKIPDPQDTEQTETPPDKMETVEEVPSIRKPAAFYSLLQIVAFLLAILLTIAFGIYAVWSEPSASKTTFELKYQSN